MFINGSMVSIRPFVASDAPCFVRAVIESVGALSPYMEWAHEHYSMDEALQWFSICDENRTAGDAYDVGIFDADTEALLGGIAINEIQRKYQMGNIGYWVRVSRQRRGIAAQACALIIPYALSELGLTRLEFVIARENIASQRVAEKVGALREGVLRNRLIITQQPRPAIIYSIVG